MLRPSWSVSSKLREVITCWVLGVAQNFTTTFLQLKFGIITFSKSSCKSMSSSAFTGLPKKWSFSLGRCNNDFCFHETVFRNTYFWSFCWIVRKWRLHIQWKASNKSPKKHSKNESLFHGASAVWEPSEYPIKGFNLLSQTPLTHLKPHDYFRYWVKSMTWDLLFLKAWIIRILPHCQLWSFKSWW